MVGIDKFFLEKRQIGRRRNSLKAREMDRLLSADVGTSICQRRKLVRAICQRGRRRGRNREV